MDRGYNLTPQRNAADGPELPAQRGLQQPSALVQTLDQAPQLIARRDESGVSAGHDAIRLRTRRADGLEDQRKFHEVSFKKLVTIDDLRVGNLEPQLRRELI